MRFRQPMFFVLHRDPQDTQSLVPSFRAHSNTNAPDVINQVFGALPGPAERWPHL